MHHLLILLDYLTPVTFIVLFGLFCYSFLKVWSRAFGSMLENQHRPTTNFSPWYKAFKSPKELRFFTVLVVTLFLSAPAFDLQKKFTRSHLLQSFNTENIEVTIDGRSVTDVNQLKLDIQSTFTKNKYASETVDKYKVSVTVNGKTTNYRFSRNSENTSVMTLKRAGQLLGTFRTDKFPYM